MKSIVLMIPYFGKLPDYYPLWKISALNNPTVDFLFFTDIDELQSEKNISVIHLSFSDFRKKIQQRFDFPIVLNHPYKLCDYKPTYGYALRDCIKNYDYWGHCDLDLIFGDIRHFITDELLDSHQKILEHGHFTLYRNDEQTNSVFMSCPGYGDYDYKKALTSDDSLYFDEFLGTQLIFRKEKIPTYCNKDIFFDVLAGQKEFQHICPYAGKVIFRYMDGHLYAEEKIGEEILDKEIMYVHFQKRKMDYSQFTNQSSFYIVPNRLISADEKMQSKRFVSRGKSIYRLRRKWAHVKEYLKRYRKGSYSSFREYRTERTRFRYDMINAKREIAEYEQEL